MITVGLTVMNIRAENAETAAEEVKKAAEVTEEGTAEAPEVKEVHAVILILSLETGVTETVRRNVLINGLIHEAGAIAKGTLTVISFGKE